MKHIAKILRRKLLCAAAAIALCSGCGAKNGAYLDISTEGQRGSGCQDPAGEETFLAGELSGEGTESPAADSTVEFVYVCGEVECPGVYELPAGSRVCDAVDAAGGMTSSACSVYWNLAELLTDGQMIYVPTEEEAESLQRAEPASDTSDGRVNINTAALEELMKIPGVGEARGKAILAYREESGGFECTEDIMKVSGIGPALYEKMRDYITVD